MKNIKKSAIFLGLIVFTAACKNKKEESPYTELLTKPPYATITDSIRNEPNNEELYFRRAVLLNTNSQPEPALSDFLKAWSLKKNEKYALGAGNILLDKKPDSAIRFISDALKEFPESILLKLGLAKSNNANGKTDQALQLCDEILKLNPQQVDVLKMKAELVSKKGDSNESLKILENAYQLTPYDIDLNYELAFKYAEAKNAKVLHLCDSLTKADTLNNHAEPEYYKGIYYFNIGEKQKALSSFNNAIQQDYYYLNAHIEKGRVLLDMKKYNEALKAFQLPNTISPDFPDAWYWIGRCQEAMGNNEEAKLSYQKAYGLDNTFTEAKEAADKLGK